MGEQILEFLIKMLKNNKKKLAEYFLEESDVTQKFLSQAEVQITITGISANIGISIGYDYFFELIVRNNELLQKYIDHGLRHKNRKFDMKSYMTYLDEKTEI